MSNSLSVGTALFTVPEVAPAFQPASPINGLLDKKQAATFLGVCVGTIDNMRRDGQIKAAPVRGRVMYDPRELHRFVKSQMEGRQ